MSRYPKEDMLYDGDELAWYGVGQYPASSGLSAAKDEERLRSEGKAGPPLEGRNAAFQQISDEGPIPEGLYSLRLKIAGKATVDAQGKLDTRQGIESLVEMPGPNGQLYESPDWGKNRVRLNAIIISDAKARRRGGFYLHDSLKGFTHGCIEVDPRFFTRLREEAQRQQSRKHGRSELILKVKYPTETASTYGGTARTAD